MIQCNQQQLTDAPTGLATATSVASRQPVALGEAVGGASAGSGAAAGGQGNNVGGGGMSDEDSLQARLDALRRG